MPVAIAHTPTPPPPTPGPFPPGPPCTGGSTCCDGAGSPNKILFQSGRETFKRTDMLVNDVFPIRVMRTYSSDTVYDSRLGYGWAFSFDKRLFEYPDQSVVIRHGCGNINRYIFSAGSYQPDTSVGSQNYNLLKNTDGSFTVKYPSGKKEEYDSQGRLTASFDVQGNSLEYSYNSQGKMPLWGSSPNALDPGQSFIVSYMSQLVKVQVRHASGGAGSFVDLAYDANTGRLSSITANDGRVVTYQHDVTADGKTRGNLTGVQGLDNKVSIYKYEDKDATEVIQDYHNITHIQEGLNALPALITYNAEDRAYIESIGNSKWTFDFTNYPMNTTVTETVTDDQGSNVQSAVNYFEFDVVGFIEFKRDALGNETRYTLDNFGNRTKELIYQGSEVAGTLVKTVDRTFNVNSNPLTEVTTLTSGEVITSTWTYDGRQKASETTVSSLTPAKIFKTEWLYNKDSNGNAITVQEEKRYNDDGSFLSTKYSYNANGDVLTTTLPDGHVIVNEYGAAYGGRYITKTYRRVGGTAVTDLQQTYAYDDKGNRTTLTDALNRNTITVYDDLNRRTKVTNQLGHVTRYSYDDRGNLINITRDRSVAEDQLDITKLSYDGENRLIQIERSDAAGALVIIKKNTYDSAGQLFSSTNSINQKSTFSYDLRHRLNGVTNYKNESISYTLDVLNNRTREEVKDSSNVIVRSSDATYDGLNRQLTQIGASSGQTQTYTYDALGNRITSTDALTRPTQFSYDALNRLTQVQDADSKNTQYGYYDRGWLKTVTDPLGLITTYNYNELGQLTSLLSPDTGSTTYTYDLVGNKKSKKDARNITASYVYDDLNRLKSITYPDTTKNVAFSYDAGTFGLGRLTGMSDESGSTQYEYNHWGDLIKESRVINGQSFTTQYGYDTEHRQVGIIYPSGRIVTLSPDTNSDLASISSRYQSADQPLLSNIVYMPFGGIDTASYGNGLALNQDYDLDYRLIKQQAGTVYDRATVYNGVNNITSIANAVDTAKSQVFDYDNLDRLTDAAGVYGVLKYGYDADGNRISEAKDTTLTSTYNYPATSNKLDTITGTKANSYGYDANGNTVSKAGMNFSYDNTNRMSQAVNGAITANYKYDGKGQRVVKDVNGTITLFIFDKDGRLIAEADGSGVVQKDYVYFGDRPVAMATTTGTPALYYYHVDHLNTPQLLTSQSGAVAWSADYEVFGEVDLTVSTVESHLRFPGQYFDNKYLWLCWC